MTKGWRTGKGQGRFEDSKGMVGKLSQKSEGMGAGRMIDKNGTWDKKQWLELNSLLKLGTKLGALLCFGLISPSSIL